METMAVYPIFYLYFSIFFILRRRLISWCISWIESNKKTVEKERILMDTIQIQPLTYENFQKYGDFVRIDQVNPEKFQCIGEPPIEFYPDLVLQNIGSNILGVSLCRVSPRDLKVDFTEHHNETEEGILPLDGDVYMHVGGSSQKASDMKVEIFEVPKLTLVRLKIGVWHHAVFAKGNQPVNVLILLAERTYHNDCEVETYDLIFGKKC